MSRKLVRVVLHHAVLVVFQIGFMMQYWCGFYSMVRLWRLSIMLDFADLHVAVAAALRGFCCHYFDNSITVFGKIFQK